MRQHFRAVDDGYATLLRCGEVGYALFDGRGHDKRGAVLADPAAVLRIHADAERFELGAHGSALAMVEGAVAAANAAALHGLELGDGAHARSAEPGIVKAS